MKKPSDCDAVKREARQKRNVRCRAKAAAAKGSTYSPRAFQKVAIMALETKQETIKVKKDLAKTQKALVDTKEEVAETREDVHQIKEESQEAKLMAGEAAFGSALANARACGAVRGVELLQDTVDKLTKKVDQTQENQVSNNDLLQDAVDKLTKKVGQMQETQVSNVFVLGAMRNVEALDSKIQQFAEQNKLIAQANEARVSEALQMSRDTMERLDVEEFGRSYVTP
jgi:hypothetical protein